MFHTNPQNRTPVNCNQVKAIQVDLHRQKPIGYKYNPKQIDRKPPIPNCNILIIEH